MKTYQRVIIILICFLILAASAWYVYPLPSSDSIFFLPTAWFYANDLGFINPLVSLTYETDPLHIGRYCFHLPLFSLVIGFLSKINPSVHGLFIVCGVISMSNVLLFEKLIFKKIKRNEHFIYISQSGKTMKQSKFSESQIVAILGSVGKDKNVENVCREYGISPATFYNWKSKYGGMGREELKRMRDLESENARLKKLLADKSPDYDILKEGYELLKKL